MTMEETQDSLQAGIFKGWKASTFNVPSTLKYGTGLGGSSHDKQKAEWEARRRSHSSLMCAVCTITADVLSSLLQTARRTSERAV